MTDMLAPELAGIGATHRVDAGVESSSIAERTINERTFGIRAADIAEHRNSASMLISKMYAWRGYTGNHQVGCDPNRITLTASEKNGQTIGTLSLGIDSSVGLLADQVFRDCVDRYRHGERRVCEITKLAIDPSVKSKAVLASLFHVAFLYARNLHNCSEIFIEVNPRHRRFYQSMLNFSVEAETRDNPRVQAPAVLLRANTDYGADQIAQRGGHSDNPGDDRSLFPFFFSQREEEGILNRLRDIG